jgi:hypothetical protein
MARWMQPGRRDVKKWDKMLKSLPNAVREVAKRFDPWTLYLHKPTGHRVTINSFVGTNPVTIKVDVTGEFNAMIFPFRISDALPEDLVECDLPAADEVLGELTRDDGEIDAQLRALKRDEN